MVASAIVHHLLTGAPSPVKVDVKGGDTLEIGFESNVAEPVRVPSDGASVLLTNVTLTGPADFVFEGEIEI